jgi:hypothetical protein
VAGTSVEVPDLSRTIDERPREMINRLNETKMVKKSRCPYLEEGGTPVCHAKPGALTTPNGYEITYHCLTRRYEDCLIYTRFCCDRGNDDLHWYRTEKISAV